jgi:hypothetical protein
MKDHEMFIPEIDRLLEADEKNVATMRKVFANFSPHLPIVLNTAAELSTTCCRAFGQTISAYPRTTPSSDAVHEELHAKLISGLLLARIGALWGIAVADFLRMRLTMPMACIRLQCESLALIKMIQDNPSLAQKWQDIQADKEGRLFFREHQPRVLSILASYNLDFAYDQASASALHSRFIGLAHGFKTMRREEGHRVTDYHIILAQEFNPDTPDYFLVQVLHALRVQERIFSNLPDAAHEINDKILLETRIPQFRADVDHLFEHFVKTRPESLDRYRRAAMAAQSMPDTGSLNTGSSDRGNQHSGKSKRRKR